MSARATSFHLSDAWLEHLGIGMLVVHGRTVVRCSEVAAQQLGIDAKQVIGRDLSLLVGAEQEAAIRAWFDEVYRSNEISARLPLRSVKDATCHVRLTAGPFEDGSASTRLISVETQVAAEAGVAELRRTLRELLDGNPVPTFVLNADHVVMHWNRACEKIFGAPAEGITGTRSQWKPFYAEARPVLADFVLDNVSAADAAHRYNNGVRSSALVEGGLETCKFYPGIGSGGRWLLSTAAPIRNLDGALIGAIQTLVDITELKEAERALLESQAGLEELVRERTAQLETAKRALEEDILRREHAETELLWRYTEMTDLNTKLSDANERIKQAQNQLVQTEKLASIGQLAAGVAHEINNPIGYVFSNFGTLETYVRDLMSLLEGYQSVEPHIAEEGLRERITELRKQLDIEFLRDDTVSLIRESREGIERVRKIVQDLKDFSHVDADADWQFADLHRGLESTLNIVNNEIKYRASVVREFGQLPQVQCLPSQLNQVFMNLLVNAAHAVDGRPHGVITVRTGASDTEVWLEVADTGCGISKEALGKIFDPFFTTKPIGKGTGLGLSLSYGIVKKHHGRIEVDSVVGEGTRFRVTLPIEQPETVEAQRTEVHA